MKSKKILLIAIVVLIAAAFVYLMPHRVKYTTELEGRCVHNWHLITRAKYVPEENYWVSEGNFYAWHWDCSLVYGQSAVKLVDVSTNRYYLWVYDESGNAYVDLNRFVK